MLELFKYNFFQNAFYSAVLISIACGIIGTYIVTRRIVFISGAITHASFGGIGIGYYFGINPVIGAALFSIFSALGIEYAAEKTTVRRDSLIGILWSLGMAAGIIFVYITPGYAPNLMTYLFGNILTVSMFDIYMLIGLNILLILSLFLLYKEILFTAFDEEHAKTMGIPSEFINYYMIILTALTIVLSIRMVGIILIISLMTIPQAIAELFTNNYKIMMILSSIFAFTASITGLFFSYKLDIPSGASIIFSAVILFGICKSWKIITNRK